MRNLVLTAMVFALACSGREPPGIRNIDISAFPTPDAGYAEADVVVADVTDVSSDAFVVPNGAVVPDFSLPDINPASRTHQMTITLSALRPRVTAYYFANAI